MSVSDVGKVCLFSSISDQITINGEPVKNAKLTQIVDKAFTSGKHTVTSTTDDTGHFKFEPVFERTVSKFLPQEFAIGQHIIASVAFPQEQAIIDQLVVVWNGNKAETTPDTAA